MPDFLLVAVDVETTGFRALTDRIVELGAVKFAPDGAVLGRFSSLINPLRPCSAQAYAAHGIADEELRSAPLAAPVLVDFAEFCGFDVTTRMVGHNLGFDRNFLHAGYGHAAGLRIPNAIFNPACTLALARRAFPGLDSYALPALAARFGWSTEGLHRAAADAERARLLWLECSKVLGVR